MPSSARRSLAPLRRQAERVDDALVGDPLLDDAVHHVLDESELLREREAYFAPGGLSSAPGGLSSAPGGLSSGGPSSDCACNQT